MAATKETKPLSSVRLINPPSCLLNPSVHTACTHTYYTNPHIGPLTSSTLSVAYNTGFHLPAIFANCRAKSDYAKWLAHCFSCFTEGVNLDQAQKEHANLHMCLAWWAVDAQQDSLAIGILELRRLGECFHNQGACKHMQALCLTIDDWIQQGTEPLFHYPATLTKAQPMVHTFNTEPGLVSAWSLLQMAANDQTTLDDSEGDGGNSNDKWEEECGRASTSEIEELSTTIKSLSRLLDLKVVQVHAATQHNFSSEMVICLPNPSSLVPQQHQLLPLLPEQKQKHKKIHYAINIDKMVVEQRTLIKLTYMEVIALANYKLHTTRAPNKHLVEVFGQNSTFC
ncbi:hypothetical protein BDN71DRAFT_1429216 [Pleurotus eryngii]|uniref:Uncharacterized protein n=1 Tax=Pleurotus eryngii TaxID=5323 RepID=A0A9P6A1Z2_PLEER|nr:hypothetical protein BDN71DRAFT_1429216 [Pleurotus eryngii]